MQIVMARHGKPQVKRHRWIAPRQIGEWIRDYDAADSVAAAAETTAAMAARSALIVSSPSLRCLRSAQALCASRKIHIDEQLREAGLPYAAWRAPALPVWLWTAAFRMAWFCGYCENSETLPQAKQRAACAAESLIGFARRHQSVFVMGHGITTALIAKQLVDRGWIGPQRPALNYWQSAVYHSP